MKYLFAAIAGLNWLIALVYLVHGSWLGLVWLIPSFAWTGTTLFTHDLQRSRY